MEPLIIRSTRRGIRQKADTLQLLLRTPENVNVTALESSMPDGIVTGIVDDSFSQTRKFSRRVVFTIHELDDRTANKCRQYILEELNKATGGFELIDESDKEIPPDISSARSLKYRSKNKRKKIDINISEEVLEFVGYAELATLEITHYYSTKIIITFPVKAPMDMFIKVKVKVKPRFSRQQTINLRTHVAHLIRNMQLKLITLFRLQYGKL